MIQNKIIIRLINIDLKSFIEKYKYIFVYILFFCTSFLGINEMSKISRQYNEKLNILDSYFHIMFNQYYVLYFYTPMFIALITTIITIPNKFISIRIQSKQTWWISKAISISICTFIYLLIGITITTISSILYYPLDTTWSEAAITLSSSITYIPKELINSNYHPLLSLLIGFTLLYLGWFLLGIIMLLIYTLTKNKIIELFVIGLLWTNLLIGMRNFFMFEWESFFLFLNTNILIIHSIQISSYGPLISLCVLTILIILIIYFGFKKVNSIDF